ncbi:hypothetical protein EV702DRAFT_1051329 [Suillus placidus]|uniref:CxC2-like cysteine cluster KDZ transposase-associated domain-containing protein n=1 Tax=Suillus placidus TaxID=48579 RepID=A0A9P6ZG37_9AGAM|nr:hypothetical protein EV702DRAFT_1051329 [Suillus placidus]
MNNLKSRTTELVATLGRRVGEIMGNSSELEVLKDGRVETELLHKASRLLITKEIKDENSKYEINRTALTIAHAMVNPMNVDWDVNRYRDKVKLSPPNRDGSATAQPERLKKYFPEAVLGKISVPTTVVDRHGNIIVRLVDPLVTSQSYTSEKVQQWLAALRTSEVLWNAITATVAPDLFQAGVTAFSEIIQEISMQSWIIPLEQWSMSQGGCSSTLLVLGSIGNGWRGKDTWKEADVSFVYEDSDSEAEPASLSKQKHHKNIEDHGLVEYDREVHGDFWTGGLKDIQRKTKLTLQTQNDFLREYLPWRHEYLSVLLKLEQLIKDGQYEDCGGEEGFIRCLSCSGEHAWCPSCAIKAHQYHPFHNLQLWNGKFYESTTLQNQGYIMYLGHGGDPCPNLSQQPNPSPWSDLGAMEDTFWSGEGDYETQLGVSNLVIMHSTGVYSHHVSWCQCPGAEKDRHLHLLKAKLFPASITRPQLAFTFDVLDNFLIDALECKTSAMSFYQKLRHFTNNAFPDKIPDRYYELMRVSRIRRDLVNRKRFGFEHETDRSPGPGDLALYCPACPQPGINLPPSWKDSYDEYVELLTIANLAHFLSQHMKMKTPDNDASLADGMRYMVTEGPYQTHVTESVEEREPMFKEAISELLGLGQQHVLGMDVLFLMQWLTFKRENVRQMNMDYFICNAVKYPSGDIGSALIIYDVACQWSIHFHEWVDQSYHLSLPLSIKILPAIGKFHLSAHKLLCFPRFSLNFITGAGHINGEILETLWAPFNKISPTARSMTLAHRKEVLDDHMRDSNWKKLVGIVKLLLKKYRRAVQGVSDIQGPYEELTKSLDLANVQEWKKAAEQAAHDRGTLLDIYQLKMDKDRTGSVAWLIEGINIENAQDALRASIRQLPEHPTASQRTVIEEKRQKLMSRINKFNNAAMVMTNGMELEGGEEMPQDDPELCLEEADGDNFLSIEDTEGGSILDLEGEADSPAEVAEVWMPSWAASDTIMDDVIMALRQEELKLRKGQANDCLEKLRQALGDRSVVFREKIHSNKSIHHQGTRSKKELLTITLSINKQARGYRRSRAAMQRLGAGSDTLSLYQPLKAQDLRVSKEVTEENRHGQGSDTLTWFWRINNAENNQKNQWMDELSWFRTQEARWRARADESTKDGHKAYAEKQASIWAKFSAEGLKSFQGKFIVTH